MLCNEFAPLGSQWQKGFATILSNKAMITIAILAFREFFEAFLIVSIFLAVSKKFDLKREKEILTASATGMAFSFLLPVLVFFFGQYTKVLINSKNAELLEGYLLTFSGIFIAYVVFSLHKFMEPKRHSAIKKVKDQLITRELFDISLFLTIVFFIGREGFEIAMLTAASTVFTGFMQNLTGLLIGFITAAFIGVGLYFSYVKIPVCKIFQYTEYTIVLFGAAMVKNGIAELIEEYFHIELGDIGRLPFGFLPSSETFIGHLIKQLLGFEREFSLVMLGIMAVYITSMYVFFFRPAKKTA